MLDKLYALDGAELIALVIAGVIGLLWHYVAKVIEQRQSDKSMTLSRYYLDHQPETLGSVLTVVAGIWALIEMDMASVLNALLLGYTVDSHANKFRDRGSRVME